jgi:hypothetical protein
VPRTGSEGDAVPENIEMGAKTQGGGMMTDVSEAQATLKACTVASETLIRELLTVIGELVDADDCEYDIHGYCQTHRWMQTSLCPHARAKIVLETYRKRFN